MTNLVQRAVAVLFALAATAPSLAFAGPRCEPTGAWLLASVRRPAPRSVDTADVLDRLAAELAMRGITLCTAPPASSREPSTADVAIVEAPLGSVAQPSRGGSRPIRIDVEVRREGATKHASREVDLAIVPRDSRATVVALAADELVRASWDELALERQHASPRATAAAGPVAVADSNPPHADAASREPGSRAAHARWSLGARAAGEVWTGGLALLGGDVGTSVSVSPRLRFDLQIGGRASPSASAPRGDVSAQAAAGRLGASVVVSTPGRSPEISVGARIAAYALRVEGDPALGTPSDARTFGAVTAEAGPALRVPLAAGAPSLVVDASLAGALRGVAARDGDVQVTGLTGVAILTSIGIVAELP